MDTHDMVPGTLTCIIDGSVHDDSVRDSESLEIGNYYYEERVTTPKLSVG